MKIVVVGAGLIGLTSALALTRAGHDVWVVDRAMQAGSGASGQNGAQLSYAYVAPLANPDTLKALPTLLFAPDSPLKLKLSADPAVIAWFWQFARACTAQTARRTTQSLYELSSLSRTGLHEFLHGLPSAQRHATGHAANGKLVLYHSPAKMRSARSQLALMNGLGAQQSLLTREQCIEHEPALAAAQTGFIGGVLTPGEEVIDGFSLCQALVEQCQQTGRCHFVWGAQVQRFEFSASQTKKSRRINAVTYATTSGQLQQLGGDAFVIANGFEASALGQDWGIKLPVQPMRGFSIHLPQACLGAMPKLNITESSLHTVFAPLQLSSGNGLRVAGMAEMVGPALTLETAKIDTLKESVRKVFGLHQDAVAQADIKPWVGLRPVTPTALPIIGRAAAVENGFVNVGQGALGLTLAFGSAQLLVDCIQQRDSAIDRRAYLPTP